MGLKTFFLKMGHDNEVGMWHLLGHCERFMVTRAVDDYYNLQGDCGEKYYVSINHDRSVNGYHSWGHCQRFKIIKDMRTENEFNLQGDCGEKWFLSVHQDGLLHGHTNDFGRGLWPCQRFTFVEVNNEPSVGTIDEIEVTDGRFDEKEEVPPTHEVSNVPAIEPTFEPTSEPQGCSIYEKITRAAYARACKQFNSNEDDCKNSMCSWKKGKKKCLASKKIRCNKVEKGDMATCCSLGCTYQKGKCKGVIRFGSYKKGKFD